MPTSPEEVEALRRHFRANDPELVLVSYEDHTAIFQLEDCDNYRIGRLRLSEVSALCLSTQWESYSDLQVYGRSISFEPPGPLPNDFVNDISVKAVSSQEAQPMYLFEISVGSGNERGETTEVRIRIEAKGIHLEDPAQPGVVLS